MRSEYSYKVGDIVNEKLEILELIKITKKAKTKTGVTYIKGYRIKCLKCGYIHEKSEGKLKIGNSCPCCCKNPQVVVKGINDVATTHPHLVKYFVNIEDAYTHTYASNKKCIMKCPECGFEKWMTCADLFIKGFSCNRCGDGVSYPNKFVTNILTQLGIDFEVEKVFDWANDKRYDIYIPSLNIIIENHGRQHYENSFEYCGGRSLEEEQENDRLKKELALNNNIKYYIVLDCRESTFKWIRKSIIDSRLLELLSFKENDVDWLKCEEYCATSMVKIVSDIWENETKNTKEIEKIVKLKRSAVVKYLKIGRSLGWCNYDPVISKSKTSSKAGKLSSKTVYMYDLDMNFIGEFSSCSELDRQSEELFGVKLDYRSISGVCVGRCSQHKGYVFSYVKK